MKQKYVIFSSEGFWSDLDGWSLYKDEATIYSINDVENTEISLHSKNNDARFIKFEDAETLEFDDFLEKLYAIAKNTSIEVLEIDLFADKEKFIDSIKDLPHNELVSLLSDSVDYIAYETEGFEFFLVKR